jgi:hypothetical protein
MDKSSPFLSNWRSSSAEKVISSSDEGRDELRDDGASFSDEPWTDACTDIYGAGSVVGIGTTAGDGDRATFYSRSVVGWCDRGVATFSMRGSCPFARSKVKVP